MITNMPMWKWELLIAAIVGGIGLLGWAIIPKKNPPVPTPVKKRRKWTVPDIYAEKLWDLWTKWSNDDDFKARYLFWKEIERIFPDTKNIGLRCDDSHSLVIIIEESFDDDEDEDED